MNRDNVTPFRPRRAPQKPKGGGFNVKSHRGKAVLVQALTLLSFGLSIVLVTAPASFLVTAIAITALIVAQASRRDSMPWAGTHHEHALRTLVFGYVVLLLARLTLPLLARYWAPAGEMLFWITIVVLIWAGIRSGIGLILAIVRHAIWHPTGVLL